MPFKIYEPHPSTTQTTYTHSGRGGFGNHFKPPPTTSPNTAQGPASLFTQGLPVSSPTSKYSCGRGGAGNMHPSVEKAVYNFDDELNSQLKRETSGESSIQYIGRGGAGNRMVVKKEEDGKSLTSVGSEERRSGGFLERLSGAFERR